MDIKNKTTRPLRIQLAGGKRLFLGPGGVGQISPKAAEQAQIKQLIEKGELEVQGGGAPRRGSDGGGPVKGPNTAGPSSGGVRHTGDR